jgi:hypothetical protein
MSNTGTSVSGFAENRHEITKTMQVFDQLPENVRRAFNAARAEWDVHYFAQWLPMMGPSMVETMIRRSDDEWTKTAYADRGFDASDISALTKAKRS